MSIMSKLECLECFLQVKNGIFQDNHTIYHTCLSCLNWSAWKASSRYKLAGAKIITLNTDEKYSLSQDLNLKNKRDVKISST